MLTYEVFMNVFGTASRCSALAVGGRRTATGVDSESLVC